MNSGFVGVHKTVQCKVNGVTAKIQTQDLIVFWIIDHIHWIEEGLLHILIWVIMIAPACKVTR